MCGICGKLNFDSEKPVNSQLLQNMMDLIRHRGPDGEGTYLSGPVGLGHRRLSIIDVESGAQPMSNEDGSVWVVFNGEIYNFKELRSDLVSKGHVFKTNSDTEVIVHLYEEYGDNSINKLQGMFAYAIWDQNHKRLLLVRDRVGIKPLYYTNTGKSIVFGSELKTLLADPEVKREIDPQAIDLFLSYNYQPGNKTTLKGIYKLEPGHYLTVLNGKVDIHAYWNLRFENNKAENYNQKIEELQALLSRTVKSHMISDVPVGVLLSGGVDSTAILNYAAQHSESPIHTFTMGFSGHNFADERPYARIAAEKFGAIHHEISMTATDFKDFLPKYVWHMEELVCEPPAVALYFVSQLARDHSVKVLLSGEGGDEAFGGYQTYRNIMLLEKLKDVFGSSRGLLKVLLKLLGQAGLKQVNQYLGLIDIDIPDYYFSRTSRPNIAFNRLKDELYNNEFKEIINRKSSYNETSKLFSEMKGKTVLSSMLYVDTKTWLPDDLLVKADKMTMAASVELRVPLLDYQVLEFAATLPDKYKVKGWQLKRILKAAVEAKVPKEILQRKKTGFPVPYDFWMRNDLKSIIHDSLLSDDSVINNYFDKKMVIRLLDRFEMGENHSKEIFSLLCLDLWNKRFIKGLSSY